MSVELKAELNECDKYAAFLAVIAEQVKARVLTPGQAKRMIDAYSVPEWIITGIDTKAKRGWFS